ncbi:MAG: J domain-containing protein, partial [Eggerthellaceae bacterium]|nr:J domain-containing protein [Eggerthellaceae bacterium]
GALIAIFMRRIVWLAGIAGTAAVWGLIEVVSTTQNINSLSDRLDELTKEKKRILQEIEELG